MPPKSKITLTDAQKYWTLYLCPRSQTEELVWIRRLDIDITDDTTIDNLSELINKLHLSDPMQVDEFLFIPEENIVYDIPDDDQLIREIAETFKEEMDDSTEITTISASSASKSLENVRLFSLQQEDTGEQLRLLNNLERFVSGKMSSQMKQTTINKYFN